MEKFFAPETGFVCDGSLIYNLKQAVGDNGPRYKQGLPVMCNDVTIKFAAAHDSTMTEAELHEFAEAMTVAANKYLQRVYGKSFSNEPTEMVGRTVVVTYGHHFGVEGKIDIVYPAGVLDEEEIFKIRFSKGNVGQFTRKQFDFVKQIVTA